MTLTQRAAALICGCDGLTQEQTIEILALAFEQVQRDTRAEQAALLAEVRRKIELAIGAAVCIREGIGTHDELMARLVEARDRLSAPEQTESTPESTQGGAE